MIAYCGAEIMQLSHCLLKLQEFVFIVSVKNGGNTMSKRENITVLLYYLCLTVVLLICL